MSAYIDMEAHPYQHIIRPHHIGLLAVFLLGFHPTESKRPSSRFQLHLYRVLLNEVSEISKPMSYVDLLREIESGLNPAAPEEAGELVEALRAVPQRLNNPDFLSGFFSEVPILYTDHEEEPSPFLLYRRAENKAAYSRPDGIMKLQEDFAAWAAGDHTAGYEKVVKDRLRDDNAIVRTSFDTIEYAEPETYAAFEKAQAVGDSQKATESLRQFFEQKFSENADSDVRQHAMLNLVRMHYSLGQFPAARKLLLEAITVARTTGDNVTLQHCMGLLRRLTPPERGRREPLNEIQADTPPLEVLNDVSKLIREAQPLSDSFEKIVEALGLYDISRGSRGGPPDPNDQWAFHGVQAIVWRLAGCEKLAAIEENIVLAFTESGGSDDTRCKVLVNRAQVLARQGRHEDAFKILLDPETWRGLNVGLNQSGLWAGEIWHTMVMMTTRRGQRRQFRGFVRARRPGIYPSWKDYFFGQPDKMVLGPGIENSLFKVLQLRHYDQAVTSVDQLLKALWQSEYQGRFRLYRLAVVLLADVGLEFGMTIWCRRLLDELMPQIIDGDDIELRAFACFVQARCIIASCGKNLDGIREALPFLDIAETDYRTIESLSAVLDVQYVTSVVYHNLGLEKERDEVAARHMATEEERRRLEGLDADETFKDIWNLVTEISAALSSR